MLQSMESPGQILRTLERLKEASGEPARFSLHPPLPEHEVVAFEEQHHIALPEDYRNFLCSVGNGGAGPSFGIYKLGMDYEKPISDDILRNLPKWFLHQDDWDAPEDFPDPDHRYYANDVMQGAMPISTVGCGTDYWLIVSGPSQGQIWLDSRADRNGIEPIFDDDDEFATFGTWYSQWLQSVSSQFRIS